MAKTPLPKLARPLSHRFHALVDRIRRTTTISAARSRSTGSSVRNLLEPPNDRCIIGQIACRWASTLSCQIDEELATLRTVNDHLVRHASPREEDCGPCNIVLEIVDITRIYVNQVDVRVDVSCYTVSMDSSTAGLRRRGLAVTDLRHACPANVECVATGTEPEVR